MVVRLSKLTSEIKPPFAAQPPRWTAKPHSRRKGGKLGRKLADWQRAIRWSRDMTKTARLIALEMLDFYNSEEFTQTGEVIVWPSVLTISRNLGIPASTVRAARAQLTKCGMIRSVAARAYRSTATFAFDDNWLRTHPHRRSDVAAPVVAKQRGRSLSAAIAKDEIVPNRRGESGNGEIRARVVRNTSLAITSHRVLS